MKKSKKYWYRFEIYECPLCQTSETIKFRVYSGPKPEEKYDFIQFACPTHFV